jgi:hypothetical protein
MFRSDAFQSFLTRSVLVPNVEFLRRWNQLDLDAYGLKVVL